MSGDMRAMILAEAHRLFFTLGYRSVTTRMVAEACGVTQPALYHHFRTKEDLYEAVVLAQLDRLQTGLHDEAIVASPFPERLAGAAAHIVAVTEHDHAMMMHDLQHELGSEARERIGAAFFGTVAGPIVGWMSEAQAMGTIAGPESGALTPFDAAMLFMDLVAYVMSPHGEASLRMPPADAGKRVARLLLHGISPVAAVETGPGQSTNERGAA